MNIKQLQLVAQLLRLSENTYTATEFVLIHGWPQADAARITKVLPTNLSRALRKIRELDVDIRSVYAARR